MRPSLLVDFPILQTALASIRHRLLRSSLLSLVAAVGIASVVSTVALINGAGRRFHEDLQKVGLDVVNVQPRLDLKGMLAGIPSVPSKAQESLDRVARDHGAIVAPVAVRPVRVGGAGEGLSTQCLATTSGGVSMRGLPLLPGGRFFNDREAAEGSPVCVVDEALARRIFEVQGDDDLSGLPGRTVHARLGRKTWTLHVVGVLKDPYVLRDKLEQFDSLDMARHFFARILEFKNLYVPLALLGDDAEVSALMLRASSSTGVKPLLDAATEAVKEGGWDDKLRVWSQAEWVESALKTTDQLFLLGNLIWMVLLGIAGIMIVTISLLAVRERYREVAIRRTEGARRRDVVGQFALEGLTIAMVGGVAGCFMGAAFANFISTAPLAEDGQPLIFWAPYFTPGTFVLAASLAAVVGILSTVLPARKIAELDPVEVLKNS